MKHGLEQIDCLQQNRLLTGDLGIRQQCGQPVESNTQIRFATRVSGIGFAKFTGDIDEFLSCRHGAAAIRQSIA